MGPGGLMGGSRDIDNRRWNGEQAGGSHAGEDVLFEIPIFGDTVIAPSRYSLLLGMGEIELNITTRLW
jgi:hypothetical protein